MMNIMENIPSHVFDLIEEKNFPALTALQQKEVLEYFSTEEYNDLHEAAVSAKYFDTEIADAVPLIGQKLFRKFDEKYPVQKKSFLLYSLELWKVAAIILFLSGGALWLILQAKYHKEVSYVMIKDTVYVPSFSSEEIKIHDTVYLDRGNNKETKKETHHRVEVITKESGESTSYIPASIPGTNLLSNREKDALPDKQKRNPLKEDTALHQFKFIKL